MLVTNLLLSLIKSDSSIKFPLNYSVYRDLLLSKMQVKNSSGEPYFLPEN
jgi:hypothetical protein